MEVVKDETVGKVVGGMAVVAAMAATEEGVKVAVLSKEAMAAVEPVGEAGMEEVATPRAVVVTVRASLGGVVAMAAEGLQAELATAEARAAEAAEAAEAVPAVAAAQATGLMAVTELPLHNSA